MNELSVISLAGRSYAANLVWTPTLPGPAAAQARKELCAQLNSKLWCAFTPCKGYRQYGVGDGGLEHRHGLRVLATNIRHPEGKSFCGVWLTEDMCWVVLAIEANRTVQSDKIFANETEAKIELITLLNQYEWEEIIVPENWEMQGKNSQLTLEELLTVKKVTRLLNETQAIIKKLLWLFVVLMVVGAGFKGYTIWQESLRLKALELEKKRSIPDSQPVKVAPAPWLGLPEKIDFLQQCVSQIMEKLPDTTAIPGWQQSGDAECTNSALSYKIARQAGTMNWFKFMKDQLPSQPHYQIINDKLVEMTWPMTFKLNNNPEPVLEYNAVTSYLNGEFQEMNRAITFSEPEYDKEGWQKRSFSLAIDSDPFLYMPLLIKINNLHFERLIYTVSSKVWTIQGVLYELAPIEKSKSEHS